MESSSGIRNWRGEIISRPTDSETNGNKSSNNVTNSSLHLKSMQANVSISQVAKDEFGRNIKVSVANKAQNKLEISSHGSKKSSKSKYCDTEKTLHSSKSKRYEYKKSDDSPPPDPYRPDLDIDRESHKSSHRRRRYRSRSRSLDKKRRKSSRSRHSHSRCRRRSSSVSRADRKKRTWNHDAFENRSPSPIRRVNPMYKPPQEAWVSRAGGVYLPRSNGTD